jgi:hypothetical protein
MTGPVLVQTRIISGVWEGVLDGSTVTPSLQVTHQERVLDGVEIRQLQDSGAWLVRVPVPLDLVNDGVQTFVISDAPTGEKLSSFAIIAGEALADDIRAEVDLLRAELDMLKRAFRRHCAETA